MPPSTCCSRFRFPGLWLWGPNFRVHNGPQVRPTTSVIKRTLRQGALRSCWVGWRRLGSGGGVQPELGWRRWDWGLWSETGFLFISGVLFRGLDVGLGKRDYEVCRVNACGSPVPTSRNAMTLQSWRQDSRAYMQVGSGRVTDFVLDINIFQKQRRGSNVVIDSCHITDRLSVERSTTPLAGLPGKDKARYDRLPRERLIRAPNRGGRLGEVLKPSIQGRNSVETKRDCDLPGEAWLFL